MTPLLAAFMQNPFVMYGQGTARFDAYYLDAMIVAAVKDFDQMHGEDGYYAMDADMSGNNAAWLIAHREQMLATTVEDIREYADFIDEMIRQGRVFAYTNEQGAKTSFPFEETLHLLPL